MQLTHPIKLGVNIDHVATIRQARQTDEPDPVWAAALAELAAGSGPAQEQRKTSEPTGRRRLMMSES